MEILPYWPALADDDRLALPALIKATTPSSLNTETFLLRLLGLGGRRRFKDQRPPCTGP